VSLGGARCHYCSRGLTVTHCVLLALVGHVDFFESQADRLQELGFIVNNTEVS
jgi:hypothetical protein